MRYPFEMKATLSDLLQGCDKICDLMRQGRSWLPDDETRGLCNKRIQNVGQDVMGAQRSILIVAVQTSLVEQ